MENTKHTPGTWSVHYGNDNINCDCKLVLSDIVPICIATINVKLDDSIDHSEYPDPKEAKANAKLIAAAPELLSQLKECKNAIEWFMENAVAKEEYNKDIFETIGVNTSTWANVIIKKATE